MLHLEWEEKNGAKFNIDIDLVPILPTSTSYSGDISQIINHLTKERPIGWVEELAKLGAENMMDVVNLPHLIGEENWHVNMRLINPHTVLPRQVCI